MRHVIVSFYKTSASLALVCTVLTLLIAVTHFIPPSNMKSAILADDGDIGPGTFADGGPLPKLIVFDLDYTLWPFWVDTHVSPPIKSKDHGNRATDRSGESFGFYSEVPSILRAAKSISLPLGLASRTHTPDLANQMLKLLMIREPDGSNPLKAIDFFSNQQIYPGDKRTHMHKLSKSTHIAFEDILFFDDETRNRNVESLGVCFWLVEDGVSRAEIDNGVKEWRKRRGNSSD